MLVTIANEGALFAAVQRAAGRMRTNAINTSAVILGEALVEVSESVPYDTGRLAGAYAQAAMLLGAPGGDLSGALPNDADVQIGDDGTVQVEIKASYWRFIEEGTEHIEPGFHIAAAMENVRRRLSFGRGATSLTGQLAAGWADEFGG